jgi:hypothetical protein
MQLFRQVNRDEHDDHASKAVDQIDKRQKPYRFWNPDVRTSPMAVKSEQHRNVFIWLNNDKKKFGGMLRGAAVWQFLAK